MTYFQNALKLSQVNSITLIIKTTMYWKNLIQTVWTLYRKQCFGTAIARAKCSDIRYYVIFIRLPHVMLVRFYKRIFLDELGWEFLTYSPYSPDVTLSDIHFRRSLQNHFRGSRQEKRLRKSLIHFLILSSQNLWKKASISIWKGLMHSSPNNGVALSILGIDCLYINSRDNDETGRNVCAILTINSYRLD